MYFTNEKNVNILQKHITYYKYQNILHITELNKEKLTLFYVLYSLAI